MKTKIWLAVALAASVAIPAVYASGLFPDFPIVGSAAFCASTNSQSTSNTVPGTLPSNSNCTNTVPAGPTSLTGNELVPADTKLANGAAPQTVMIPTVVLGAGAVNYQTPLTGATVTANPNESTMLIDPAGTIATLTVVMPGPASSLKDGQTWRVTSSQTVTALTLTPGTGTTIGGNAASTPTAITPSATSSTGYEFIYKASNAKWYRVQ